MKSISLKYISLETPRSKRLFDIGFSAFVLLAFSPLFFLITLLIRLSSRGKALYAQERIGQNGKAFKCLKFRTMVVDAEQKLADLLESDPLLKKEWEKHQKLKNDPRIFKLGAFLRKTSLDELPQFINVLKGDLSVVGPRPYLLSQRSEMGRQGYKILSVRPGITGIWQTSGRSSTTFKERIEMDASYIEASSFWFDLSVIAKTLPIVFLAKNAH